MQKMHVYSVRVAIWGCWVPFRRVRMQEMHVYSVRMAIWGWLGAILEGWCAGNAHIVHQNDHLGLVGCHFGGSRWRGQWLGD